MSQPAVRPDGSGALGATLLFSLLLHGVLLLGITFHFAAAKPSLPTLDVTLVDVANREAPDKADFLAQANNQGGGDSDKAARPSQIASGLLPTPSDGVAPQPLQAGAPKPQDATDERRLTTSGNSSFSVASDDAHPQHDAQPLPESPQDIQRDQEMARLAAALSTQNQAYAKRPHKKFISANTKEFAYAAYMRGMVDRIERVGNLNYPEIARRKGLHGDLLLTVTLDPSGRVIDVEIVKSSGYPELDNAAKRIVGLAAPFPPLPATKERVDELHITRTWEFQPEYLLHMR